MLASCTKVKISEERFKTFIRKLMNNAKLKTFLMQFVIMFHLESNANFINFTNIPCDNNYFFTLRIC